MQEECGRRVHLPHEREERDGQRGPVPEMRRPAGPAPGGGYDEAYGHHAGGSGKHQQRDDAGLRRCGGDERPARRRRGRGRRGERQDRHLPVPEPPVQQRQSAGGAAPRGRQRRPAAPRRPQEGAEAQVSGQLLHQSEPARPGRQAGRRHWPRAGDRARGADTEPPPEEQPLPHRRAGRGQDRHCRGPGPAHRLRRRAFQAAAEGGLPPRPHRAGGGHPVPWPV